ncbi:uncharacterized protein LOC106179087 [Lingula anatina]|uniref:Uncharacterized protein LOC106179087 n=1 Tax=Lingula anatina TaxID=7574 RepID=A0A1S3K5Z6_LINAN|nr:uncharacterized protein LOC106179087 [Lingula anatina]|eukprot:XP_013418050.1 uncharacterized protein LOC106179087 [Lingula anatina]
MWDYLKTLVLFCTMPAICEVGALCTPRTDHNDGQESATSNGLEVEEFQRIKVEAWENILTEEMVQKMISELGDGFVDELKDPLELQKVKEEAKTVVRYWLRQREGVPFLQLQDLFIDCKEAQYNIKKQE